MCGVFWITKTSASSGGSGKLIAMSKIVQPCSNAMIANQSRGIIEYTQNCFSRPGGTGAKGGFSERVSAAGIWPYRALVKPPAKPVVMIFDIML